MDNLTFTAIGTADPLLASTPISTDDSETSKIENAAHQFESFLIAQMLQSVRESHSQGFGEDDSEASSQASTMFDIADQQFAQMLSRQGGFGLARLVVESLSSRRDDFRK